MLHSVAEVESLSLEDDQIEQLKQIINQDLSYIDDPSFQDSEFMNELFDQELPEVTSDWYLAHMNENTDDITSSSVVLTPAQERVCFLQYNYGKKEMKKLLVQKFTPEICEELLSWAEKINDIKNTIVGANLALIINLAKKFKNSQLDFNELVGEGHIAMLNSIDKFNVSKGFKFSTYLYRSIITAFGKASTKWDKYHQTFPCNFDHELQQSDLIDKKREEKRYETLDRIRQLVDDNTAGLDDDEMYIIRSRYLHSGKKRPTLEQTGQAMDPVKSKAYVSKVERRALSKLREALLVEMD